MLERTNYSTGAPWEARVGYSRAVKVGNIIEVTGTVAVDENGQPVAPGDAYAQTRYILEKIEDVLHRAGATLRHVVRTRIFVTDIARWEEYGRAHQEYFHEIRPCTTMVEVSRVIHPDYLVEIEASAIL